MLVLTLLNFPMTRGPKSKPAPRMQAPASTGIATDITMHFLPGPAWSAGLLGRREPALLSLQTQETQFQPAASQVQSNAQGCRPGQPAFVQDMKEFMQLGTAGQVFVACRDAKEMHAGGDSRAPGVFLCPQHVQGCKRVYKECNGTASMSHSQHVHRHSFHRMQDAFNSLCKACAEWKLFPSMQGELSSSRVDRYLLLLTAVSPGGTVM